ncbi:MAG: permease [Candidatus Aminicenantes bacterium]|nr:MAG: permease [Candidatus Aminicenantes bacterium]
MKDWKILFLFLGIFLLVFWLPVESTNFQKSFIEGFALLKEYAREHVLLCLVPAFFIAGAISVFVSKASVIKYFGAQAKKILSYSVASVSGTILAVCSCTVLPLFAGIYTRGAGIGPATAFLYSGPAINVLAIILTAKVLGYKLGLARAVGAIVFAVIIGLLMHFIFHKEEERESEDKKFVALEEAQGSRALWKNTLYFASMVGFLVFINWGRAGDASSGIWVLIYRMKWIIGGVLLAVLAWMLWKWFKREEIEEWMDSTWGLSKQILPLLFIGVLVAGFLLGRPGHEGAIPGRWVASLVGGNSLWANLFASMSGALMYFATLTEVPILQGLLGSGMGQGPALALLLAGPALSLPNMLVIRSIIGTKKTLVYIGLVILMATISGLIYGLIIG